MATFKTNMLEKIKEQKTDWEKRMNKRADAIRKPTDSSPTLISVLSKEVIKNEEKAPIVNAVKMSLKDKIEAMR